jgi:hypothetical protein
MVTLSNSPSYCFIGDSRAWYNAQLKPRGLLAHKSQLVHQSVTARVNRAMQTLSVLGPFTSPRRGYRTQTARWRLRTPAPMLVNRLPPDENVMYKSRSSAVCLVIPGYSELLFFRPFKSCSFSRSWPPHQPRTPRPGERTIGFSLLFGLNHATRRPANTLKSL